MGRGAVNPLHRVVPVVLLAALVCASATSCGATSCGTTGSAATAPVVADAVAHDVYVWRRTISDALRVELRAAAAHVGRFKLLAREHARGDAPDEVWVDWQPGDLPRGREVAVVWRIGGTAVPGDALDVRPLLQRALALRAAGVDVTGIEIDHDCPTRALAAYAAWLQRVRATVGAAAPQLRLSITALPTWAADRAALAAVVAHVDGVTVQVHTVRAPAIFDVDMAASDLDRFVAALPPATVPVLRVALPTYRATLTDGAGVSVTLAEVQRFLSTKAWPRVSWFRLGADDDEDAWGAATLAAAIAGGDTRDRATVRLQPTTTAAVFDVVLENSGAVDVDAPARIRFVNAEAADGLHGYGARRDDHWRLQHPAPPRLRPGKAIVVGWVRGRGVVVAP